MASFPQHKFSLRDEQNTHFCSATLIQPLLLLTAAHCLPGPWGKNANNLPGAEDSLEIREIKIHPNFDVETLNNNIALLRLHPNQHEYRRKEVSKLPPTNWVQVRSQIPGKSE